VSIAACIPVIVLSTSVSERDIRDSYMSGANCYIRKPMGLEGYRKVARLIADFWFGLAELPTG
jgi:CheY-like chemotaxis protein